MNKQRAVFGWASSRDVALLRTFTFVAWIFILALIYAMSVGLLGEREPIAASVGIFVSSSCLGSLLGIAKGRAPSVLVVARVAAVAALTVIIGVCVWTLWRNNSARLVAGGFAALAVGSVTAAGCAAIRWDGQ